MYEFMKMRVEEIQAKLKLLGPDSLTWAEYDLLVEWALVEAEQVKKALASN